MQEYEFPEQIQLYYHVKNSDELKILIKSQLDKLGRRFHHFTISEYNQRYIYARCTKCSAKLKYCYQLETDAYRLIISKTKHIHNLPKNFNHQISKWIENLPANMTTNSKMKITTNQFSISKSKLYYLLNRLQSTHREFPILIKQLDDQGFDTRYEPYPITDSETLPTLFLTISPEMKTNYKKFGKCISFDITYHVVRQKQLNQKGRFRKYGLGMFVAINNHNHIIILGIVILNDETSQSMYQIFNSFFEIMEQPPETIISDEQASIISSLKLLKDELKWSGNHLLDNFHIIRNLKKKTKNKQLINSLIEAISAQHHFSFNYFIQKAKQTVKSQIQSKIIIEFITNSDKYCFSQVPLRYCGLSISSSYNQKINDIVKQHIQYAQPFVKVIKKVIRISKNLFQKSSLYQLQKTLYEEILDIKFLKYLRFMVVKRIFHIILKKIIRSLSIQTQKINIHKWLTKSNNNDYFEVDFSQQKFSCSCHFTEKTLLPCEHIYAIAKIEGYDLNLLIPERWQLNLKAQKPKTTIRPLGRGLKSRKNRQ